jgi:3'-phosphoadenosine 5'-phosphosulfate sulfotransferase (PAPS reductase)/FAD synthetase
VKQKLDEESGGSKSIAHVVMFSGGAGSWATAKRVVAAHGAAAVTLLFADTRIEDEDLYRFLLDAEANIGAKLIRIADGRTPWDVYHQERFLGNARIDPCSRELKRKPCLAWLERNCDPACTRVYVGIDWTEEHRYRRLRNRYEKIGWEFLAPLCDRPLLSKVDILAWMASEGLVPPRLYGLGFAHNNCGGFCCKGGQANFARLWREMPDRYLWHEGKEIELRKHLGKDVAIMTDRRGGRRRPLTMKGFRERLTADETVQSDETGGCGCFAGGEE